MYPELDQAAEAVAFIVAAAISALANHTKSEAPDKARYILERVTVLLLAQQRV